MLRTCRTMELQEFEDPIDSLIEIINSVPVPIVIIRDDGVAPVVVFKNSECTVSNIDLLESYRNCDPLADNKEKIYNMKNGDILWQFNRAIDREDITFDVIIAKKNQERESKNEVTDSSMEVVSLDRNKSEVLKNSIKKIKNTNDRLELMIKSRMDSLSPESKNNILLRRGLLTV